MVELQRRIPNGWIYTYIGI